MLTVFHNRRWDGDFLTVRKVLPRLGEVALFEAHWDRFRPEIKQGWREVPKPGGGVLERPRSAHDRPGTAAVRDARRHLGGHRSPSGRAREVDDYFDLTLHYGERRVCLALLDAGREPRPRFAVHGNGGLVRQARPRPAGGAAQGRHGPARRRLRDRPSRRHADIRRRHARERADRARQLSRLLRAASPTRSSTARRCRSIRADARAGLMLIDLARRAAELGQRLPVPAASSTEA